MAPRKSKLEQLREWTRVPEVEGAVSPARDWRQKAGHSPEKAALTVGVSSRSVTRYEVGSLPRNQLHIDSYYAYLKKIKPQEEK